MSKGVEAKFIVCEDVRTETNGKLTLTGVYPSEVIVLNKPPAVAKAHPKWLAILPRIAFVGFIRGVPEGRVDGRVQVTSPSGEAIMMADLREVNFEDARSNTPAQKAEKKAPAKAVKKAGKSARKTMAK